MASSVENGTMTTKDKVRRCGLQKEVAHRFGLASSGSKGAVPSV